MGKSDFWYFIISIQDTVAGRFVKKNLLPYFVGNLFFCNLSVPVLLLIVIGEMLMGLQGT